MNAEALPMFTTCPSLPARRSGRKAWVIATRLSTVRREVVKCRSSGTSRKAPPKTIPALLTSTSIGPPSACTASRSPRMREGSTRSTTYVRTRAPPASAAAVSASAGPFTSTRSSSAPSAAKRAAIARPIPAAAPVTSARLTRSVFTVRSGAAGRARAAPYPPEDCRSAWSTVDAFARSSFVRAWLATSAASSSARRTADDVAERGIVHRADRREEGAAERRIGLEAVQPRAHGLDAQAGVVVVDRRVEELRERGRVRPERLGEPAAHRQRRVVLEHRHDVLRLGGRARRGGRSRRGRGGVRRLRPPEEHDRSQPAPVAVAEQEVLCAEQPLQPLAERETAELRRHRPVLARPSDDLRAALPADLVDDLADRHLLDVHRETVVAILDAGCGGLRRPDRGRCGIVGAAHAGRHQPGGQKRRREAERTEHAHRP